MSSIEDLRKEIEAVDSMMIDLLKKRLDLVRKAGSEPLYSQARETYILNRMMPEGDEQYYQYCYRLQNLLFDLTEQLQNQLGNRADPFLRENSDLAAFKDSVFALSHQAALDKQQHPDQVINATIGSLHDENDALVTFKSVYDTYNAVPESRKASYAEEINGNPLFRKAVYDWINRNGNLQMPHEVVASAGGTGALALGFNCFLQDNDYVLLPSPAWGNYRNMAKTRNLNVESYSLINEKGMTDLNDLMTRGIYVMKKRHKLVLVINDPCQNPTGISLSDEQWKKLTEYFNRIAAFGKVIVMVDLAYLDYCNHDGRAFLKHLNGLNDNVLVMLAFSCSKTLTAYGMRLGAAVILGNNQEEVDRIANNFTKTARALWSNVNNGMMDCFAQVTTERRAQLDAERQQYVDLIRQRAEIFLGEAVKLNLPLYPYSDGFFCMLRIEDEPLLNNVHKALLARHIYTIKFTGGLRIALCSLNREDCRKLPLLLSSVLNEVRNQPLSLSDTLKEIHNG